jgi:hypothetical protein
MIVFGNVAPFSLPQTVCAIVHKCCSVEGILIIITYLDTLYSICLDSDSGGPKRPTIAAESLRRELVQCTVQRSLDWLP